MSKHTPIPWKVIANSGVSEIHAEKRPIARMLLDGVHGSGDHEADINARHIVHCVNLHDELVDALNQAERVLLARLREMEEPGGPIYRMPDRFYSVAACVKNIQDLLAKTTETR